MVPRTDLALTTEPDPGHSSRGNHHVHSFTHGPRQSELRWLKSLRRSLGPTLLPTGQPHRGGRGLQTTAASSPLPPEFSPLAGPGGLSLRHGPSTHRPPPAASTSLSDLTCTWTLLRRLTLHPPPGLTPENPAENLRREQGEEPLCQHPHHTARHKLLVSPLWLPLCRQGPGTERISPASALAGSRMPEGPGTPVSLRAGTHRLSSWTMDVSRWPLITICCSFSCFATCVTPTREDKVQVQTWSPRPGRLSCPQTQAPPAPSQHGEAAAKKAKGKSSLLCPLLPRRARVHLPRAPATVANALRLALARTNCHVCAQAHPRRRAKPSSVTPAAGEDAGAA